MWAAAYVLAVAPSGIFVRWLLHAAGQAIPEGEANPGRVIGKLEDFLVVTLVMLDALTALAVVFGAKSIARVEMDRPKASYYVLGTLANFAWAIGVAALAVVVVARV